MSRSTVAALVTGLFLSAVTCLPTGAIAFGGHGGGMGGFHGGGMASFHGGGMGAFHGGMGAFRGGMAPNGFVSGRGFAGRHFVGHGFNDRRFFVRDFRRSLLRSCFRLWGVGLGMGLGRQLLRLDAIWLSVDLLARSELASPERVRKRVQGTPTSSCYWRLPYRP